MTLNINDQIKKSLTVCVSKHSEMGNCSGGQLATAWMPLSYICTWQWTPAPYQQWTSIQFVADFAHIPWLMELFCHKRFICGTCGLSSSAVVLKSLSLLMHCGLNVKKDFSLKSLKTEDFFIIAALIFHVWVAIPYKKMACKQFLEPQFYVKYEIQKKQ